MRHSIILPTRNRNRTAALCIWSIQRSAAICGIDDYEIIVVDNGSDTPLQCGANVRVVRDDSPMPIFCKPTLQNIGIQESAGEVISFLDADTLVPLRWMDNIFKMSAESNLTKLCYRVRHLALTATEVLESAKDKSEVLDAWFEHYGDFPLAHEGYILPERNKCDGLPIFGNSQFSIRRDVLGTTRFNEEYIGRGYEDLWMNRELWMRDPDSYRAEIVTDADHALFHVFTSVYEPDWYTVDSNQKNVAKYHNSWRGMKHPLLAKIRRRI